MQEDAGVLADPEPTLKRAVRVTLMVQWTPEVKNFVVMARRIAVDTCADSVRLQSGPVRLAREAACGKDSYAR